MGFALAKYMITQEEIQGEPHGMQKYYSRLVLPAVFNGVIPAGNELPLLVRAWFMRTLRYHRYRAMSPMFYMFRRYCPPTM